MVRQKTVKKVAQSRLDIDARWGWKRTLEKGSQKNSWAGTKPVEVPTFLEMSFTQGGWGVIQPRIDLTKKVAVIRIENCYGTKIQIARA